MSIVEAPRVFPRFDDFVLYFGGLVHSKVSRGDDVEAGAFEDEQRWITSYAVHVLTGLLRRPVECCTRCSVDTYVHAPEPMSSGATQLDILIVYEPRVDPLSSLESEYDHFIERLTGNPRTLNLHVSVWAGILNGCYDAFWKATHGEKADERRRLAAQHLLYEYPTGEYDTLAAPMLSNEMTQWMNALSLTTGDSLESLVALRLGTRLKLSTTLFAAYALYACEDSYLKDIAVCKERLAGQFAPDSSPARYVTRCEFFAYLNKKLAFTIKTRVFSSKERLRLHIEAIDALRVGLAVFPRVRLAKYVADHLACIARLLNDDSIALLGRLVYTYWYAGVHAPLLHQLHGELLSRDDLVVVATRIDSEITTPIWQQLEGTHPLDINAAAIVKSFGLPDEAAAIRDLHVGYIHNVQLLKSAPDEVFAFCRNSGLDPTAFADHAGTLLRLAGRLHAWASPKYCPDAHADVASRTMTHCWDVCYEPVVHSEINRALSKTVNRLREIHQGTASRTKPLSSVH